MEHCELQDLPRSWFITLQGGPPTDSVESSRLMDRQQDSRTGGRKPVSRESLRVRHVMPWERHLLKIPERHLLVPAEDNVTGSRTMTLSNSPCLQIVSFFQPKLVLSYSISSRNSAEHQPWTPISSRSRGMQTTTILRGDG